MSFEKGCSVGIFSKSFSPIVRRSVEIISHCTKNTLFSYAHCFKDLVKCPASYVLGEARSCDQSPLVLDETVLYPGTGGEADVLPMMRRDWLKPESRSFFFLLTC